MPYLPNSKRKTHKHKKHKQYNSPAWRKARLNCFKIKGHNCVMCGAYANTVDHIVSPHMNGGSWYDVSNLQPLCRSCHNSKSAKDRNQYYNG